MPVSIQTRLLRATALVLAVATLLLPSVASADPIFTVTGRGWGHGIGMTQYGAYGYALQGKTFDWIVGHYFAQTSLATRSEITVKVDLDASKSARSAWRISSPSSTTTLTVTDLLNGAHSVEVTGGVSVWVKFKGGRVVLYRDVYDAATGAHSTGSLIATFPAAAYAATGSARDSMVTIRDASGPFGDNSIAWRGQIRFEPNTTTGHAINYVLMEQYLRGVVPRESPSSWPAEALKAQAVAARGYAYRSAVDHPDSALACTTSSQVYNGARHGSGVHEAASTDAAIAATANQYVVYGTRVVQTFFSSSSGGRTANVEDVWYSSEPQPYYTSVADADDPVVNGKHLNGNYRWSLADMTGATLGAKIRDYDNGSNNADPLDYSAPSPATLANLTVDAAASGWVRSVTLTWSNGRSYTITGTRFQSILGLKSSAFAVKVTNPLPPVTRYQDTDARPLWTGTWAITKTASATGGSYHRSATAGATFTAMFKGSTVSWVGTRLDHAGKAEVSLDGTRVATVDLYSSTTRYRSVIWSRTGLAADTTHTLVVKVLGTHRSGSDGSWVYVDALDITGSLIAVPRPPSWKRYDQSSAKVSYRGTWKTSALSGLYGGTHAYSHATSSTATFAFSGTQVRWIGKRAANYGKAWVSVDSSPAVLVDLYSATTRNQQRLFQSAVLAPGAHKVTVRVAGTKNSRSTYHYVDVDAFEALEPAK